MNNLRAYNAMYKFLELYYFETYYENLGGLLSGMQFLMDGNTADPAYWNDWKKITGSKKNFSPIESYSAMLQFLKINLIMADDELLTAASTDINHTSLPEDVREMLKSRKFFDSIQLLEGKVVNQENWDKWMKCVNEALQEPEGTQQYLKLMK